MKSVSLGQLSKNPIEFLSEPVSGVEGFGVSSGLDAVAGVANVSLLSTVLNSSRLTWRTSLDAFPPKFRALPTGYIVVALDFQPRAFVACMPFSASLQRTRYC